MYSVNQVREAHEYIHDNQPQLVGKHWMVYLCYLSYIELVHIKSSQTGLFRVSWGYLGDLGGWVAIRNPDIDIRTWVARILMCIPEGTRDTRDTPRTMPDYVPTISKPWWESFQTNPDIQILATSGVFRVDTDRGFYYSDMHQLNYLMGP